MQRLVSLWHRYAELLLYLIVGGATTVISVVVFYLCNVTWHMGWASANVWSWLLSVTFAFLANKHLVFADRSYALRTVIVQGVSFYGARLASLGVDMALMAIGIDWLRWNALLVKLLVQVVIVVLNYVFSKWLFKHRAA